MLDTDWSVRKIAHHLSCSGFTVKDMLEPLVTRQVCNTAIRLRMHTTDQYDQYYRKLSHHMTHSQSVFCLIVHLYIGKNSHYRALCQSISSQGAWLKDFCCHCVRYVYCH
ncbi:hypothetical protein NPIL_430431 [Nephila pilipes]|uniref:Uncharacterized protein n=1 Tax=Nephila pilipes TaxID=299642 RepID=A0A8X6MYL2_NEPPI|nr:hypothetical protein NPIL_430431 [Nephila pilipes]